MALVQECGYIAGNRVPKWEHRPGESCPYWEQSVRHVVLNCLRWWRRESLVGISAWVHSLHDHHLATRSLWVSGFGSSRRDGVGFAGSVNPDGLARRQNCVCFSPDVGTGLVRFSDRRRWSSHARQQRL